jgi:hypothetical protein
MKTNQPSFPTNRAFVVQFHTDVEAEEGQFYGRVEHVVSGQATRFDSVEGLAAFITQVLKAQSANDDESSST